MLKTRLCVEADIPQAMELIKEFYSESIEEFGLIMNLEVALLVAKTFVSTSFALEDNGKLIGILCGTISKMPLSEETVYQEAIWYVRKNNRIAGLRLYGMLETFCKVNDIKKIIMVSMSNSKADKLGEFYNRLGFKLLEKHYIKTI